MHTYICSFIHILHTLGSDCAVEVGKSVDMVISNEMV